jgi:AcrR family transcriptional regulator
MAKDDREPQPDAAVAIVRRAPFSDNPRVGVRGLRTQQRILDAALEAFAQEGYHGCSVDRITKLARCSRVSFYQYFASKDDVFKELAGQVARQVSASTEALDPLTDDARGWSAMRAWVARYAETHARYEPVFHALESDDVLAAVAWRTGEETVARIHARLTTTTLPPRQLDPVIRLLLECVNHTLDITGILRSAAPDTYPHEYVETVITDVLHRTLFGVHTSVNVHLPVGGPLPVLAADAGMLETLRPDIAIDPEAAGNRALEALLTSGRAVFVERGYHNTRVDDLVTAAGVSHGAFYRYFESKEQLARILTASAVQVVGAAALEMPDVYELDEVTGRSVLRRWLRRYNSAHSNEAAMLRIWVDAAHQDPTLRSESAPLLDWGRRRMARYLRPRGFGDIDTEAVVMVGLLGVFGARPRPAAEVDAAAHIIERGLLGRSPSGSEQQ